TSLPGEVRGEGACDGHGMAKLAIVLESRRLSLADPLNCNQISHPSTVWLSIVRRRQRTDSTVAVGAPIGPVFDAHQRRLDLIETRGRVLRVHRERVHPNVDRRPTAHGAYTLI